MTLREAEALLAEAGIDSPAFDARELLRAFGGLSPAACMMPNAGSDAEAFLSAVKRRAAHEPLQYIIGEVGFFREIYEVSPSCLIPRADTELLVETAISLLPDGATFFDLCTGSGCIAVSVLANTKNTSAAAADISEDALALAKRNAARNGVADRVDFIKADVLALPLDGKPFAILSNPPYVANAVYQTLAPEIAFEPKIAFVGGDDGLDFYRRLIPLYRDLIPAGGFFAFEIGADQGDALISLAKAHSLKPIIKKDLSGLDRVAVLLREE